ncbi:serine hydrolase domain-containing protein [Nocardioides sp.]|uniref:serine hydrolase domain-containing protein n=1 Tax=Nocardioides sp. TaxID=35761 RepID=UPI003519672E
MVHGTHEPRFAPLRDLFAAHLADGTDVGASIAVVHDGAVVADLWGGEARPGVAWERDTIVQVWSVTKTMAALAVLVLAEQGAIDVDAPVARYWPAFAAHGKDDVRVRQVLGHTSGVPGWTRPVSVADMLDLPLSEEWLAAEESWYEPGSAPAYQILNHGHLLDAIVRGATGRTLAQVLRTEITGPLGADFLLGVPMEQQHRCADLIKPPPISPDSPQLALPPDHFLFRTLLNPNLSPRLCNGAQWRAGEVGAAGGHGGALGVALAQAPVSHGGAFDTPSGRVRLLGEELLGRLFEVQASGTDLVLDVPLTFGIGYGLPTSQAPAVGSGRVLWWTGWGGSVVVNDLDRRATIAYTPNRLVEHLVSSPRTDAVLSTAFACLDA